MKGKKLLCAALACVMSAGLAVSATACGGGASANLTSASIVVNGYDWGPGVSAVVAKFDKTVSGVNKDTFTVKTANAKRTVTDAYSSDKDGNRSQTATEYVTFVLKTEYTASMWGGSCPGTPFTYDMKAARNDWSANYNISLNLAEGKTFKANDKTVSEGEYTFNANKAENRILQTANWNKDSYRYTGEGKDITLSRASWTPAGAATDGGKNPLIIWLHGGGEGGTDIDIALLGNEVTGLTTDNSTNVQHYFQSENSAGAYVLAVQSPTMWMDAEGDGKYGNSDNNSEPNGEPQTSYYTQALYAAITDYVEKNSDIDADRIYVGGCSNGGYMTMNLAFEYGDYFAAYYPICQGYMSGNISDDMLESIKDKNIWFLLSQADRTLTPSKYTLPLFNRLVQKGAQNVHLTLKEDVKGNDSDATYDGHWSWIYAFNDDVKKEFDNSLVTGEDYLVPANCTKDGNMWEWLSQQAKEEAVVEPVETYEFEAENAKLVGAVYETTDWQGNPVTATVQIVPEIRTKYTGDLSQTGEAVTAVGYFNRLGTTIT